MKLRADVQQGRTASERRAPAARVLGRRWSRLGGARVCDLCASWGAPWCLYIGGEVPWVVQDPAPKFGQVPVGFRFRKPTPTGTSLPIPNLTLCSLKERLLLP